jgi:hypothetical protein
MRARSVYGCLYSSCLQSYGTEHVARFFDLSGYIASSSEKMLGTRGVCLLQGPAHAISLLFQSVAPGFPLWSRHASDVGRQNQCSYSSSSKAPSMPCSAKAPSHSFANVE